MLSLAILIILKCSAVEITKLSFHFCYNELITFLTIDFLKKSFVIYKQFLFYSDAFTNALHLQEDS